MLQSSPVVTHMKTTRETTAMVRSSPVLTRTRTGGPRKTLLDGLDLSDPVVQRILQESNNKVAEHRKKMEEEKKKKGLKQKTKSPNNVFAIRVFSNS